MRFQKEGTPFSLLSDSSDPNADVGAQERPVGTRNDCKKHLLDCLVTPSNIKDDKGRYLQEFFSAIASALQE